MIAIDSQTGDGRADGSDRLKRDDVSSLMLLTLGWIALVVAFGPAGNFPLIDDWVYAHSVRTLAETGRLTLLDFSQAFGVPQALLGALVTKVFGFSFVTLRTLGLGFGWAGVLATYALARQFGALPRAAALVAAAVAANPLYLSMAATFMTDVPFYFFAVTSLALMLRGLRTPDWRWTVAGLLTAGLAILTRQLGLVLMLGFAAAHLVTRPRRARAWLVAALPLLAGVALHLIVNAWLGSSRQNYSSMSWQGQQFAKPLQQLLKGALPGQTNLFLIVQYLSLFALPSGWIWLRCRLHDAGAARARIVLLPLLGWCALAAWIVVHKGFFMPSAVHLLMKHGIGPLMLKDTFFLNRNDVPMPPWMDGLWAFVSAASVFAIALTLQRLAGALMSARHRRRATPGGAADPRVALLVTTTVAYIFLIAVVTHFYADRYLLLCLPMLPLMFLADRGGAPSRSGSVARPLPTASTHGIRAAWLMVAALAAFSVLSVRDFLEFSRQRWLALDTLTRVQHVVPARIDGGYEFNGLHLYRPGGARTEDRPRSWWWVTDDEYVVASGPIDGYREVMSYPFRRWLIGGQESRVVVLRRVGASALQRP